MARIEIAKTFPFIEWNAERKNGRTSPEIYVVILFETAKSKAKSWPFIVATSWGSEKTFSIIDDAIEYRNQRVHSIARESGWTPEGEIEPGGKVERQS